MTNFPFCGTICKNTKEGLKNEPRNKSLQTLSIGDTEEGQGMSAVPEETGQCSEMGDYRYCGNRNYWSGDDKPTKVADANSNGKSSNANESQQNNAETDIKEEENEETVFRKGEIAELNGAQVTLTDYKESTGSDYNKPTDGNVFLMVEFEISNNTEKELAISSAMSFDAYANDYAPNFSFSALMEKEGNQLDGTIATGKKLKGWIGWEVPADYQNVEIHFTDNVWSSDKFVFVIEK